MAKQNSTREQANNSTMSRIETALQMREGEVITSIHDSAAPQAITKERTYTLVDKPVALYKKPHADAILAGAFIGFPINPELAHSRNSSQGELCNALFPIMDDRGRRVEVCYIHFDYSLGKK